MGRSVAVASRRERAGVEERERTRTTYNLR